MPPTNLNRFFISIVIPSILAMGLLYILHICGHPSLLRKDHPGREKKGMISELTNSVCSLIGWISGRSRGKPDPADSAKSLAVERVRLRIRYGAELKDYFWIIDKQPRHDHASIPTPNCG